MRDRLIRQLQEIKLFEEDLFPNATPEDIKAREEERVIKAKALIGKTVRVITDIHGAMRSTFDRHLLLRVGDEGVIDRATPSGQVLVKFPDPKQNVVERKFWLELGTEVEVID